MSLIIVKYFQFIKGRFCLKMIEVYLDGFIVGILMFQVRGLVAKCKTSTETLYQAIHKTITKSESSNETWRYEVAHTRSQSVDVRA